MLTSILRTLVPALWGSFIVWLLALVPALEPVRELLLSMSDLAVPILTAVIIAAWYALWRRIEPVLPGWLTAALLGSSHAPVYAKDAIVGELAADGSIIDWHDAGKPKHSTEDAGVE